MEIRFIGTGSGETSLKRDHSSLLFSTGRSNTLIDCGDGVPKALLKNNIEFNSINNVILTHFHADHFSGIAPLITQMKLNERKSELKIYTHHNLVEPLKNYLHTCYLFESVFDFNLSFVGVEFDKKYILDEELSFIAKQNSHVQNKHDVKEIPSDKFISSSLLFNSPSEKIIYTSDIGKREDLFLFENIKPKIYITETTHIDRDWVHGIIGFYHPEEIYLTHISDEDEPKVEKHLRNQTFPTTSKVLMAKDGHIVTLS